MEKTIEVNDIVKAFNLEVLTAEDELDRLVAKSTARRLRVEYIYYLDYVAMWHVPMLGVNEIHSLHTLENEERRELIEKLVRNTPPSVIVTDNQTGVENMMRYCT